MDMSSFTASCEMSAPILTSAPVPLKFGNRPCLSTDLYCSSPGGSTSGWQKGYASNSQPRLDYPAWATARRRQSLYRKAAHSTFNRSTSWKKAVNYCPVNQTLYRTCLCDELGEWRKWGLQANYNRESHIPQGHLNGGGWRIRNEKDGWGDTSRPCGPQEQYSTENNTNTRAHVSINS